METYRSHCRGNRVFPRSHGSSEGADSDVVRGNDVCVRVQGWCVGRAICHWGILSAVVPNLDLSQSQSRRPKDGGDPAFSILAVLVVFNRGLDAIPCVPQLRRWLEEAHADAGLRLSHVLIYDNSDRPSMGPAALRPGRYDYIHDASNGGTRAAYHAALRRAQKRDAWFATSSSIGGCSRSCGCARTSAAWT